ncbi:nitroreductase [Vibrio sp. UCD-FRSSP16_10]|uniref:nitroreductase family protein n=1 Tax=unclassified Vibrio TaxID=2614977 RepID=UPI0008019CF1|nr:MULTISPECIES: nitroreductase family protein [unclassified Vibrio]OBT13677.1 nitroreductase [Vibrio sp. UCD-FRSSP16_30]OBT19231.1 nitroreductase [Vibrio sp. UCD-FRSSP16_10]
MTKKLKTRIKGIIGQKVIDNTRNYPALLSNFFADMLLYYKHSTVFFKNTSKKIECQLILDYHSVEKGLLFEKMKPRFARDRIVSLHKNLVSDSIVCRVTDSQINIAYKVMCEYYELHQVKNIDISNYFTEEQYNYYKELLSDSYKTDFKGAITYTKDDFYENINEDFVHFSNSRKSIRKFTGDKVDREAIEKAITLALNTPSVCNRQASKVYLIDDKDKVTNILKLQGGLSGYTENISQLLILTTDRNLFYTIGERNQFYIDGGMFLMNLLYALHFYRIANCPANWGKTIKEEKRLEQFFKINSSEKIICIIPIGVAEDEFRVTLSKRRDLDEVLIKS